MRRTATTAAGAAILAAPFALAFFSGGFFDRPRLAAGAAAWVLVAVAAVAAPRPLPARVPGRVAVAGLALLTAWTGASLALWAPLSGPATDDLQRLLLYLAALIAAAALLRARAARRALEPAMAAGVLAVAAFALSERLLPGLVELDRSATAGGRLEQPLTYWNALGAMTAIGLVLCARLAGDRSRPAALRAAAAAAAAPAALATYLSFSRGALGALAVGVAALFLLAPTAAQARALAVALAAGAALAGAVELLPAVRAVPGTAAGDAAADGRALLGVLVAVAALAAAGQALLARAEAAGRVRIGAAPLGRRTGALAAGALALGGTVLVAAAADLGAGERGRDAVADPARLGTVESNRYAYWRVAAGSFAARPVTGVGSGGFRVEWLRERRIEERAADAHSLPIETAAELGLVGLALLGLLTGGVVAAVGRLRRLDPAAAAGPGAALAVWAAHAAIDWDWEMPALSLVALVIAGAVIAGGEEEEAPAASAPAAGARPHAGSAAADRSAVAVGS